MLLFAYWCSGSKSAVATMTTRYNKVRLIDGTLAQSRVGDVANISR